VTKEWGSEWVPIKVFLRIAELNYAPKSQVRVPTQTCQGHIVRMDLPTVGTSPKQIQSGSTTLEAKDLGNLQWPGWIVHRGGGLSAGHGQTIQNWLPNH
jgi:hypothetical protein